VANLHPYPTHYGLALAFPASYAHTSDHADGVMPFEDPRFAVPVKWKLGASLLLTHLLFLLLIHFH